MAQTKRNKIARRLSGEPFTDNGRTIQLVAQASGWSWGDGRQRFAAALVRLQPVEVHVREGASLRIIPISGPTDNRLLAALRPAIFVTLVCWLVIFVARRFAG